VEKVLKKYEIQCKIMMFLLILWSKLPVFLTENGRWKEKYLKNNGYLYYWFHRKRDANDVEWNMLSVFIFGSYFYWLILYSVIVSILSPFISPVWFRRLFVLNAVHNLE